PGPPGREHPLPLSGSVSGRYLSTSLLEGNSMLRPGSPWRTGINRALALGPSRIALGLAIVLVLVSLALPFWSLSRAIGADQDISSFSWTTFTTDSYHGCAWDRTEIRPYTSTLSPYRAVASVLATAYLLDLVMLVVLEVVLALFSIEYGRAMPALSLLSCTLI